MMKIKRYYQDIGYPEDMREHDGYGDWVKYEDVEPLLKCIEELLRLLSITEETDDGRVFRPNRISSCRALDAEKLNQVLVELKRGVDND